MVLVDDRPGVIDYLFRGDKTATLILNWPAGYLAGKSFTATLGGVGLAVTVTGDVMTIVASDEITAAAADTSQFVLKEGSIDPEDQIIGTWVKSTKGSQQQTADVTVNTSGQTVTLSVTQLGSTAFTAFQQQPEHQQVGPLSRYRADAARARAPGISAVTVWLGDSFTESYEPTKRGLRWTEHLARRLNGVGMRKVRYFPITTNALSTTTATDWPGDQPPWTYNGTVTGSVAYGADLHAATLAAGAFVELPYFGDNVVVIYTRTPDGPSAAAVTVDGVSVGSINANGSELPGQQTNFGTPGDYGAHTLRITATGAPLVLEGAMVHDGSRIGFGQPNDSIFTLCFGHTGFQTSHFTGNTNWSKSLAALSGSSLVGFHAGLVGILLGANDAGAGVLASTFQSNLVAIMQQIDADIDATGVTTDPGFLLVMMPTTTDAYRSAAFTAAAAFGSTRCGVLDLRAYLPGGGSGWGIFDAGNGHPNDAGQLWIANTIADYIEGPAAPGSLPIMPPPGPVVEAADNPTARSSWTESLGVTNGQVYDATPNDTTQRERRHRIWLEPGTYAARIRYEQRTTGGGTLQVLVGHTSCGTVSTAGTDGTITETQLGTTVVIDSPGAYPVTIRKTTAAGLVRFVRLHLRRTA